MYAPERKGILSSVYLAMIVIWTALVIACVLVVIYPVPGTPVWITLSSILSSGLTAPLLGPTGGTVSGMVLGLAGPYLNPLTYLWPLTFLSPMLAALMSGLVLFNRWKEATLILACQMGIWFAHPFAWYRLMPIVSWEYWLALILITVPPVRRRIIDSIVTRNPATLPLALWCLAWVSRVGGDVITGNNAAIWVLKWTYDMYFFWAPMTIYYAIVDSLNCVGGALIGTAVLLALKRSGFRVAAVDFFQPVWERQKAAKKAGKE